MNNLENLKKVLSIIRSNYLLYSLLLIIALLIVIVLILKKENKKSLIYISIPTTTTGLITLITSLFGKRIIINLIPKDYEMLIKPFINIIMNKMIIISIGLLVAGFITAIVYFLLKIKDKYHKK